MKFIKTLILILFVVFQINLNAQELQKPTFVQVAKSMVEMPSLSSRSTLIPAVNRSTEAKDKRSGKNVTVYGKGLPYGVDALSKPNESSQKLKGKAPSLVFDGASSNSTPTDPDAAVGPNHCVIVFNNGFRIFDKSGVALTAQLAESNIFPIDGCCDLTACYDTQADRFVLTYLGNGVQVAVSKTSNPVTGGWWVYNFPMTTDYQKLSVWSDGYYFTANKDQDAVATSEVVFAIERAKMLTGDLTAKIIGFPLPGIVTSGFYCPQAFNVTSSNFPAPGNVPIVYMQDDAWSGVATDNLKLWTVNVDWSVPTNSTISSPQTIPTTPFTSVFNNGSFVNLTQPNNGPKIDALQATIMNQAQFRKFPTHNSAIFNFVIDTDASAATSLAAVRWYELRQTGDGLPWSVYQEGTYNAPNGKHAWNASMGIDALGNIAMGYSGMGGTTNQFLSSFYTGRYVNDPLGTMTIAENLIAQGTGNIPSTRYGDYSKLALDPSDNKTFWFVTEMIKSGRKDVVGVFKIAPNFNTDIGANSIISPNNATLTNNEVIKISIFNYGQNAASNFPVTYQINGGNTVTETFTGSIASASSAEYTFTTLANLSTVGQTYSIKATTLLTGDEEATNNFTIKSVTNLNAKDLGVSSIISPVSGSNLTGTESIKVKINNFGGLQQSNFNVSYTLDGNTVNEVFTGSIPANSSVDFTFAQTGNLVALGNHTLSVKTSLAGDSNVSNDEKAVIINKINCQPTINCTDGDGLRLFKLGTINNPSECGTNGYNDFTNLSTDLIQGSTTDLTIKAVYGNQNLKVWVDFNDDFVFTNNEKIINNYVIAPGVTGGNYTRTIPFVLPATATLGEHLMRAKTNWNAAVSDDACFASQFGETEDYKLRVLDIILEKQSFVENKSQLKVISTDNKVFEISLEESQLTEQLILTVHNTLGQNIAYQRLKNLNGKYSHQLDLSYAQTGVYLVKIGNDKFGKIQRIIVK